MLNNLSYSMIDIQQTKKIPQPGLFFHSYNKNFGHVHIDVDKDYKTVEINHQNLELINKNLMEI